MPAACLLRPTLKKSVDTYIPRTRTTLVWKVVKQYAFTRHAVCATAAVSASVFVLYRSERSIVPSLVVKMFCVCVLFGLRRSKPAYCTVVYMRYITCTRGLYHAVLRTHANTRALKRRLGVL